MASMKLARAFFTIAAMACAVATQAAVEFANTLGDGDIANPNNWPNGTLPTDSDTIQLKNKITYKVSEDVTFGRQCVIVSGTCKFDLSESDATVTLTGSGTASSPSVAFYDDTYNNCTMWLIGGKWDLTGDFPIFTAGQRNGCKIIVTDGCRVTINNGYVMPGYSGTGANNRIVVTNGASISTKYIRLGYVAGASNGVLEIAKDGSVSVSDITVSETQSGVTGGTIYVHGANSKFTGASGKNVNIGYASHDAKLFLDDGASFTCGSLYVGNRQATSGAGAYNNRLVASNSTITAYQNFSVGHYGNWNTAEIYNTPISAGMSFFVGSSATSCSNSCRLIGSGTTLSYVSDTATPLFNSGSYNTLTFEGGASHTLIEGANVTLSKSAHHNTIRISGSGSSLVKTGMKLYMSVSNDNSYANSIIAEDGGTFQFYDMYVCRQDNLLVVSNGTMTTLRNDPASYSLHVGSVPAGSLAVTTNNAIVVQGDSPKVYFPHTGLWMGNGSRLHFDVPVSGVYADVPIQVVNLSLSDDCTLSAAVEACLAGLNSGSSRRIVLAELQAGSNGSGQSVGGNLTIPQSVLNAANETLPKGCKFYTESKKLMLKVGKPGGMILVVQ